MINPIGVSTVKQNGNRRKVHKNLVTGTGYAATGFGTLCAITGFKSVNFSNKMKVHRLSAWVAAISTVLHIGVIKGFDRFY